MGNFNETSTFSDWLKQKKKDDAPETPGKFKPDKGLRPCNEKELKKFRHADLIVLPDSVEGTNCGNCKFADKTGDTDMNYCKHKDLEMWVTERMCCKMWDHKDVKRNWKTD